MERFASACQEAADSAVNAGAPAHDSLRCASAIMGHPDGAAALWVDALYDSLGS